MMKKLLRVVLVGGLVIVVCGWFFFWDLIAMVRERAVAEATVRITEIEAPIYRIDTLRGGRPIGGALLASVGEDGVLLVDSTASPTLAEKVQRAVVDRWSAPIVSVVLTHPHPDHVTGAVVFANSGSEIIGHARTAHWMSTRIRASRFLRSAPAFPLAARPSEVVSRETTLEFNGEQIRLLPLQAGHTDGDLAVVFTKSKVVHIGDVFHGPGSHSSASWVNGGTIRGLLDSVGTLVSELPEDIRIVGGHSPEGSWCSRTDLLQYRMLLERAIAAVEKRLPEKVDTEVLAIQLAESTELDFSEQPGLIMHGPLEGWLENIERSLRTGR